jgi:Uma2 family endonuclease
MSVTSQTWPRPHRLTVDEYYRMAEVGLLSPDDRVELIEGEIVEMPPIGDRHAAVVDLLARTLIRSIGDSAHVRIQGPIRLGVRSEPQPDVTLLERRADSYKNGHPTAAEVQLVIEVSESTLRYDLDEKARLYARHGVAEYWVLDLIDDRLHRFRRPAGESYAEHETIDAGAVRFEPLNVLVDLDDLF